MGKIAAIIALILIVSMASAQSNWYAKPAVSSYAVADSTWDTTWFNQNYDMVWIGTIINFGADTLQAQPIATGKALTDSTTGRIIIFPGYTLNDVLVGKGIRIRVQSGASIRYLIKYN